MTKLPIVQICFSLTRLTIEDIRKKLIDTKVRLDRAYPNGYLTKSCHLSREILLSEGIPTTIPDVFEEIFGKDGYQCELTETNLEDAKRNMNIHRQNLSKAADTLVVLSETELTNVALEIELFTENHLMII